MAEGDVETAVPSDNGGGSKFMQHEGPKKGVKYPLKLMYVEGE